jgi:cytochrome c oxidase subunit 4
VDDTAALTGSRGPADDVALVSGHDHPEPAQYVRIAVILAVATAIEVLIYYIDLPAKLMVAVLVGLASVKFALVAAYFMHLKFDAGLLRRVFLTGIILACVVYAIALFTLKVLFH